jgi:hypothetical protein
MKHVKKYGHLAFILLVDLFSMIYLDNLRDVVCMYRAGWLVPFVIWLANALTIGWWWSRWNEMELRKRVTRAYYQGVEDTRKQYEE